MTSTEALRTVRLHRGGHRRGRQRRRLATDSSDSYGHRIHVGLTSPGTRYASAIREARRSGPVTVDTIGLYVSTPSVFDDLPVARSYSRSNG
jgi:hypothetical protein